MKILFLDTYYQAVLKDLPISYSYCDRKGQLSRQMFGTSDFYSHAFKQMGWQAEDLVANDEIGLRHWTRENGFAFVNMYDATIDFIRKYKPDILYCQDLSYLHSSILGRLKAEGSVKLLACQHSCPWAGNGQVSSFDIVFTSFPHYLDKIREVGPRAEFLPIAFGGERVLESLDLLDEMKLPDERPYKISFVGGISAGKSMGHWQEGTDLLRKVAVAFPLDFRCWGYGFEMLSSDDPLYKAFKGSAWGSSMYRIYSDSAIIINRHGEVAEGYSNNMRLYEATGLGSVLFTEKSKNLTDYFDPGTECIAYDSNSIVNDLTDLLNNPTKMNDIAILGNARTMKFHTYTERLKPVEKTLRNMIHA